MTIKGCNPSHLLRLNTGERTWMLWMILTVVGSFYSESNKIVTGVKLSVLVAQN